MKHLTLGERYHILAMKKLGYSLGRMAKELNRSKSTLSEEISRNTGSGDYGYRPQHAHNLAQQRWAKSHSGARKLKGDVIEFIEAGIRQCWSPEQVAGRLYNECGVRMHHETIYQYVYRDRDHGGDLHTYLRRSNKIYKKRYGGKDNRKIKIKDRRDISERPEHVEQREELGHWEGDTVKDPKRGRSIVTLVERKTRLVVMMAVASLKADEVSEAIVTALSPLAAFVLTLTMDNGSEFAQHQKFGAALNADVFFATPYHSWERGTNENTNGLIRQYYPKRKTKYPKPEIEILKVEHLLNSRPRKTLHYMTPLEAFEKDTGVTITYQ